jgi:hypothetical protein
MKYLITLLSVTFLVCGCQTPGKIIATTSTSVDHAMQTWAVYVVDGKATPEQETKVKEFKLRYDAAEDLALSAFIEYTKTDDKSVWLRAKDLLKAQQLNLINLVNQFTGKGAL